MFLYLLKNKRHKPLTVNLQYVNIFRVLYDHHLHVSDHDQENVRFNGTDIGPIVFGLIGGFGSELGDMMLGGVKQIAPTGVMLIFGIMYFSIMIDVGLFKPLVAMILKLVKGDPLKVTIGTAILTLMYL